MDWKVFRQALAGSFVIVMFVLIWGSLVVAAAALPFPWSLITAFVMLTLLVTGMSLAAARFCKGSL